ncbi:hypothetical protein GCM10027203_08040 [Nonomuraea fastidiosa]
MSFGETTPSCWEDMTVVRISAPRVGRIAIQHTKRARQAAIEFPVWAPARMKFSAPRLRGSAAPQPPRPPRPDRPPVLRPSARLTLTPPTLGPADPQSLDPTGPQSLNPANPQPSTVLTLSPSARLTLGYPAPAGAEPVQRGAP